MREQPDAVVLDLVLRRINSLSLLRSIHSNELSPALIVCSGFLSEASMNISRNLGVDFFLGKPVSFAHLHECLLDTVAMKRRMLEEARALDTPPMPVSASAEVHRTLISTGISPRLSGFYYLAEGLHLLLSDEALIKNMSRRLYPRIAQSLNTSPGNVERNIRSAIRCASKKGDGGADPPTNREFITVLFRKILEKRRGSAFES